MAGSSTSTSSNPSDTSPSSQDDSNTTSDLPTKTTPTLKRSSSSTFRNGQNAKSIVHLFACAAAIFISLVGYSYIQERVMTQPYTEYTSQVLQQTAPLAYNALSEASCLDDEDRLLISNMLGIAEDEISIIRLTTFIQSRMDRIQALEWEHGYQATANMSLDNLTLNEAARNIEFWKAEIAVANDARSTIKEVLESRYEVEGEEGSDLNGQGTSYEGMPIPDADAAGFARVARDVATDGSKNSRFQSSLFLVLANRIFAVFMSLIAVWTSKDKWREALPQAPLLSYVLVSLSNMVATSCQYEALKWLTFPIITIVKCAKVLPVMFILNLRKGTAYSSSDFAVGLAVAIGSGMMVSSGNITPKWQTDSVSAAFGFALLACYFIFDALTSTYQDYLFKKYSMSVSNQMLYINMSTSVFAALSLLVNGGMAESLHFVRTHSAIIPDIVSLSATAVLGQFAISHTIRTFGALVLAAIMTTRQFCSVLISNLLFEHGLTAVQWVGASTVFGALFLRVWMRHRREGTQE